VGSDLDLIGILKGGKVLGKILWSGIALTFLHKNQLCTNFSNLFLE